MLEITKVWTVKRADGLGSRSRCYAQCVCGDISEYDKNNIDRGNTTKCKACANTSRSIKHSTHGMSGKSKLDGGKVYYTWRAIKGRCENKNDKRFVNYGGRGISICREWSESFSRFALDMGEPPTSSHSIDRIDNNGNYEPLNCKWSTASEQANNKSNNRVIEHGGVKRTLAQWSRSVGIHEETIASRIDRYGWTVGEALTRRRSKYCIDGDHYSTLGEAALRHSMSVSGVSSRINSPKHPLWVKIKHETQ